MRCSSSPASFWPRCLGSGVETPFRTRLILKSRVQLFTFASTATAIFLLTGLALYTWQGLPSRFPAEALRYSHATTSDYQFVQEMSYRIGLQEARSGDFVELGAADKRSPVSLFIWGDSHAAAVLPVLDTLCKEHSIRGVAAMHAGTAPLSGYSSTWPGSLKEESIPYSEAILKYIRAHQIRHVLLIAKWAQYITDSGEPQVHAGLLQTISALQKPDLRIHILRQVPKPRWHVPRALDVATLYQRPFSQLGVSLTHYRQAFQSQALCFQELSTCFPSVTVLDPTELFYGQSELCCIEKNGLALYCDDSHLSTAGATLLKPLFTPLFQDLGPTTASIRP